MDWKLQYETLSSAIQKCFAAQEDAERNRAVQSKKLLAAQKKREVIELINPEKRIVSQTVLQWEGQ